MRGRRGKPSAPFTSRIIWRRRCGWPIVSSCCRVARAGSRPSFRWSTRAGGRPAMPAWPAMRNICGHSSVPTRKRPTGSWRMLDPSSRPVVFRGGAFTPKHYRLAAVGSLVGFVALWQLASSLAWVSPIFMPSPMEVAASLRRMAAGELWGHLGASLGRLMGGYLIGMSAGIAFGLSLGLFTVMRSAGIALVSALFPIPKIALLPLFILWFGIGEGSKIATIAFGTFFPTVIATYGAVDNVDRSLVRMGRALVCRRAILS